MTRQPRLSEDSARRIALLAKFNRRSFPAETEIAVLSHLDRNSKLIQRLEREEKKGARK